MGRSTTVEDGWRSERGTVATANRLYGYEHQIGVLPLLDSLAALLQERKLLKMKLPFPLILHLLFFFL